MDNLAGQYVASSETKQRDAVMIKKTKLKFTEFHLFCLVLMLRRREDGQRYLIIQLCLIILMHRQTHVSMHYFYCVLFYSIQLVMIFYSHMSVYPNI